MTSPNPNWMAGFIWGFINRGALGTYDLILDGLKPIDDLVEQVVQAVRVRQRSASSPTTPQVAS
jgi:hypothetical protein